MSSWLINGITSAERQTGTCMQIEEDLQTTRQTEYFKFAPSFLQPAELVLRAALFAMSGSIDVFPPRPPLQLPRDKVIDGKRTQFENADVKIAAEEWHSASAPFAGPFPFSFSLNNFLLFVSVM